jgi:hypothetical protein
LEKAGYSRGDLVGIELAKEETSGGFLMPYLDIGGKCLEDEGDCFKVVSYSTSLVANTTNGILKYGCTCGHCGEVISEDEACYTEQEGDVCERCFEDYYTYFEDETYRISECTRVYGGEYDYQYVPDGLLAENGYYETVDDSGYYYIDELTKFEGSWYLTENCVSLERKTEDGAGYAPESECTKLTLEDVKDLQDWDLYWTLGWYVDEHYEDIIEEISRLLNVQEAGQLDLVNELELTA